MDDLEITCDAVKQRLDDGATFLLLDCREVQEHQFVSLPQARLIPMSELEQRVSELEPFREEEIVVLCHHGGRSWQVATWLRQQGYENTFSMAGGIHEWALRIDTSLPTY